MSDPHKAADMLLKIASLYNEEPETKTAVFEVVGKQDGINPQSLDSPSAKNCAFISESHFA